MTARRVGYARARASESKTTTDHDEIRNWVEEHEGVPAAVRGTGGDDDDPGLLRIDFPGGAGNDRLERIDWDEWFAKFDAADLAFVYQEQKADGSDSTFFKLISND